MKKEFHFTDVLGVITMIILKPQGINGIGSVLCFMTGENLDRENYAPARVDCLPELIKQFPELNPDSQKMKDALSELAFSPDLSFADRDALIKEWIEKFKNGEFGINCSEFLEVAKLNFSPRDAGIVYAGGMRGTYY